MSESMVARALAAYMDFVQSTSGAVVILLLALAVCGSLLLWARARAHPERWSLLVIAGTLTLLVTGIYGLAVGSGSWSGRYFSVPLGLQLATLLPLVLISWLGWLMGYGWIADHSRFPLLIYSLLGLLIIIAVVTADRAEMAGGLLLLAADGTTWIDAAIGVAIMLAPILLFECLRGTLKRDTLP